MKVTEIIILIGSVVTAATAIIVAARTILNSLLKKILDPIVKSVQTLDQRACRRFLVDFLVDVENGIEKDEVQYKLAHEIYDHYTNVLKENSYIHDKWERVMK